MERFEQATAYKLIYVFSIRNLDTHQGLLKIGETTINSNKKPDELSPNCHDLNQAAKKRIDEYTQTAGITYTLDYTELAIKTDGVNLQAFHDKDVHRVLRNSGIEQVKPNGQTGNEWFKVNLETAKAAIKAVKDGKSSLSSDVVINENAQVPIILRKEQLDAVEQTIKIFKRSNEMLWFAKMRFGKTLTTLELIRRQQYKKVIIVTHRPVVNSSWQEDFYKIFYPGNTENEYLYEYKTSDPGYTYNEKIDYDNDCKIRQHISLDDHFIYFASMQDLRGSKVVDGRYNKNNAVFAIKWDLIVIDEAHEGTQTELGDKVIKALRKNSKKTKVLALSGTPFNLLGSYDENNVYTWDYVSEQKAKEEWDILHKGDSNPYADLPKMHIYTYDLGEKLRRFATDEYDSKAFNFREFFRVWTTGQNNRRKLPRGAVEGNFVHEDDVKSFLNLLVEPDDESGYPFSREEYRDMFRHTLWMVPGVKEANALSKLLHKHPVFKDFGIANVAGKGDDFEQRNRGDALKLVRDTIKDKDYSITLSCGRLTTGVTVPEWTAVIMLSGSYSTAASQYMQTIFRVQSAGSINGRQKTDCYVFDFAPDRTLKVLTETVNISRKPGRSQQKQRETMQEFLNYCPVIAVSGSRTVEYSVSSMMEQIKQVFAERAVNSGFDDESIYNDELLKLNKIDAKQFNELKDIIGTSSAQREAREVVVNDQGLTDEQVERAYEHEQRDRTELTPEQKAERERIKKAKEARKKAIDILRGISIRMPLLIYGANVPIDKDIGIDDFVDYVDDESWKEFMPQGVTKKLFKKFTKYYDRDVFIAAGKRIRHLAAAADKETPTRRVIKIAEIFHHFKNPDKETVLTPWRVVNMHMSDTIGGWCFFNENFEDDTRSEKHRLDEPRFVDMGEVTKTVFAEKAKILEINSKSGLYPLYVAYSFYKERMEGMSDDDWEPEECQSFWNEVLENNVYVICKTPMAKAITRRTLCGYSDTPVKARYLKNLVSDLKNEPEKVKNKILRCSKWDEEGEKMKFDAVVGNPPYQIENGGNGNGKDPIYHFFIDMGRNLSDKGTFIHPARFLFNAGKTPKEWNKKMLNDCHYKVVDYYPNSTSVFPTVDVKGGIAITYWDNFTDFGKIGFFSAFNELRTIVEKVTTATAFTSFSSLVYPRDLYKLTDKLYEENTWAANRPSDGHKYDVGSNIFDVFPELFYDEEPNTGGPYAQICGRANNVRCFKWVKKEYIKTPDNFNSFKVFIPKSNGSGALGEVLSTPVVGQPVVGHTVTFLSIGKFDSKNEAESVLKYIKTKFARTLLGALKVTQDNPRETWQYVPLQDFTENSDIDWSKTVHEIDLQLYKKYGLSDDEIKFIEDKVAPMG